MCLHCLARFGHFIANCLLVMHTYLYYFIVFFYSSGQFCTILIAFIRQKRIKVNVNFVHKINFLSRLAIINYLFYIFSGFFFRFSSSFLLAYYNNMCSGCCQLLHQPLFIRLNQIQLASTHGVRSEPRKLCVCVSVCNLIKKYWKIKRKKRSEKCPIIMLVWWWWYVCYFIIFWAKGIYALLCVNVYSVSFWLSIMIESLHMHKK